MGSETKTVIGVMNIVGGEWAAEAPNVLAVRGPASLVPGELGKGDLFVLVELRGSDPSSADGAQLCRSLTERVRDVYYQAHGGVIASLRRALAAAEAVPLPVPSQGTLAGLTAVVVRGVDVFIASAGPMVVYIVAGASAARFPERMPVSQAATGQLEPFFFHTTVAPRDMLALGDSRFAALAPPEDIAPAVARQDVEDALANLGDLVADQDCTALVVEVEAGKEVISSRTRRWALHRARMGREGGWDQVSRRAGVADIAGRLRHSRVWQVLGRGLLNLGKGGLAFFALVWRGLRALFVQMLPERRTDASALGAGQTGFQPPSARVRKEGTPLLPASEAEPAHEIGEGAAVPARPQPVLRALAIVIPLVIAIVAGVTYWRKGVAEEGTFQTLMEQARTVYQQAVNADEQTARRLLDKSDELLVQAAAIRPQDSVLVELRAVVTRQHDKVDHVERLTLLGRLRTYDNPQTHLRRVVADGLDVYVLDSGTDVLYHHRMDDVVDSLRPDEGDPVLVRRATQVGRSVVGELLDITWVAAAPNRQAGALMILEAEGLLEYIGNREVSSLAIGGRDRWVLPVAVMGYGGNFYILDAQAGQIFRYRPGEGGYPDPPESYLTDSPSGGLGGAVDMAIDGYIYVLYADGSVRKFEGGAPAPFEMADFDRPFNNPTAIFTAPDQQVHYLYVADAGNRRIVQMEKSGRFVRQLKPSDEDAVNFEGIKSIFVDELAAKMYLVDNRSLYVAGIPRIQ